MEENKDIIEKIDIQIIKPGDHDRWTNTIMDIIPVSTKVLGILGEGITHTLTGVYFMMTGVDVDGVQTYEFGSSEGNLKEKLFLDKAGTPGTNDVIISFDFLFKSHQGQERGACTRAHQACDKFMQTYRDKMKKFKGDLCTHRSTYYDTVRPGAKRVVIIKQVAGQGAMEPHHLFGKEPSSSEGRKSIIDMGNMPVIVTPNEYRDGIYPFHAVIQGGRQLWVLGLPQKKLPFIISAILSLRWYPPTPSIDRHGRNNSRHTRRGRGKAPCRHPCRRMGGVYAGGRRHSLQRRLGQQRRGLIPTPVYQLGIRGIPVTGLNFSGTMAQFVVTNEYLDAIVDISKNPEGIESENVGENAVDALDARKALAMLKIKMRKKEHQG